MPQARRSGAARAFETPATGAAPSSAELFARIQALLEANRLADDMIGRTDHVSRLPNRVRFMEDFAAESAKAGSIVLVTLADAKHFNDLLRALGHAYSEDFVRAGVARLSSILGRDTTLYHVSVLSFVFFSEDVSSGHPPAIVAEIVAAFRDSIICQDIPVDTRVGVGVTALDGRAAAPAELLRATLTAAQDSRRTHEGWAWYNRKSDEAHVRAFRLLTDMPAAFAASDQFALHYQPRIDMLRGGCIGAEALMRWTHPTLGPVSPAEFIPLAETTALITPLTHWVIDHALRTVDIWQAQRSGLKISVNISPKNLEEPDFVDGLCDSARRAGVDPALVELEFTEGMLATNWSLMMQQMTRLRDCGFEIAIDDFGSGYSNMSYLGKIPAKYLKIDQSFVRTLDLDPKNQVLVRSIIELAHALDYSVVAEGIETAASFDLLSSWRCDEGQGYLMSRPLPGDAFSQWLQASPSRNRLY